MSSMDTKENGKERSAESLSVSVPPPLPLLPLLAEESDDDDDDHLHDDYDGPYSTTGRLGENSRRSLYDRLLERTTTTRQRHRQRPNSPTPTLDALPPDTTAWIFQGLTVQEIANVSCCSTSLYVASRNPDLWQQKFQARWNVFDHDIKTATTTTNSTTTTSFHGLEWFTAYREAYLNPHDLWISHDNIVEPIDGHLTPGRCCIQEPPPPPTRTKRPNTQTVEGDKCNSWLCPTCRYDDPNRVTQQCDDDNDNNDDKSTTSGGATISTVAQAIQVATQLRLQQPSSKRLLDTTKRLSPYSTKRAEQTFASSSTMHRTIDTRQYRSNVLFFLKDLLFFQVHDDDDNKNDVEPVEIRDWRTYFSSTTKTSSRNLDEDHDIMTFETALHSWHLVQLRNPDFHRPIVWRISIQRPDCFAVFPSEGHLPPGASTVVVFGVKPLGSLLAFGSHQINVHRDKADPFWTELCTQKEEGGHLPVAPFLVHYHFASVVPCRRADDDNSNHSENNNSNLDPTPRRQGPPPFLHHHNGSGTRDHTHPPDRSIRSPWKASAQAEQPVRTMHLSAHVHGNFPLTHFRRRTLVPHALSVSRHHHSSSSGSSSNMSIGRAKARVYFCAPQLQEFYPVEWQWLEAMELEDPSNVDSVAAKAYQTEGPCKECGRTWGARREELAQAYVLAKLECDWEWQRACKRLQRLYRVVQSLVTLQQDAAYPEMCRSKCSYQLLQSLQFQIMNFRGAPWMNRRHAQTLFQWEIVLQAIWRSIRTTNDSSQLTEASETESAAGIYRYALYTDSVFAKGHALDNGAAFDLHGVVWKTEPIQLEAFSHLVHKSKWLCLGQQEDPNHLKPLDDHSGLDEKFVRRQPGFVSDMFQDNPTAAFQAALCALFHQKRLTVHGVYDRVPYPGTLVRRPKLPILPKLEENTVNRISRASVVLLTRFVDSPKKLEYYQLQNTLDLDTILAVKSIVDRKSRGVPTQLHIPYSLSLRNFLRNVPTPGCGRFALSTEIGVDQEDNLVGAGNSLSSNELWFLDTTTSEIVELSLVDEDSPAHNDSRREPHDPLRVDVVEVNVNMQQQMANLNHAQLPRGSRIMNLLWGVSPHLGWVEESSQGLASVYVDRRILIAAQWFSLTLMMLPLFATLSARYFQRIPAFPVGYALDALPFEVETTLHFLTETECGIAALVLCPLYCFLGRHIERYTSRDFFRAMLEHMPKKEPKQPSLIANFFDEFLCWGQRRWDECCPLVLQRLTFTPQWNRRSQEELLNHVALWRGEDYREQKTSFEAYNGRGRNFLEKQERSLDFQGESSGWKALTFVAATLGSFSATSPHFFINVLTVFSASISLGLSISLQSIETGRAGVVVRSTVSNLQSLSLVTVVMIGFLLGQIVGSSGGALFLAEVIVTSISLVLGGIGTISSTALESWLVLLSLAVPAFWGYLFGRVAIMEGFRQKKRVLATKLLGFSLLTLLVIWVVALFVWDWESAVELVIKRPVKLRQTTIS